MKSSRLGRHLALLSIALIAISIQSAMASPCGEFQQIPTPNPGSTGNALVGIAASDDGTAWAVGSKSGPGTLPLILRFDGNAWTEFPVPAEVEGIAFSTAGSTPGGDVWLTGTRPYDVYNREVFLIRVRDGAIDRIDQVLSAGAPLDLSATSAADVWVLTATNSVLHFDGSGWSQSDAPLPFLTLNYPKAIHAESSGEVWIVGYGGDQRGQYKGYVQRLSGSTWTTVPTPVSGQQTIFFHDIDGIAADEIWIVGHINYSQHLSLRWNGENWIQQEGPDSDAPLTQVVVLAPDNAWAAPYSLSAGFTFYQWDGLSWHERSSTGISTASSTAWRGLAKAGACDVWAAGSYYDDPSHHTLAARLSPGAAAATPDVSSASLLVGNYPNPFNPVTEIVFAVERPQRVRLSVFDLEGRRIATLADRDFGQGTHSVTWTGLDAAGRAMPSGSYLVRMKSGEGAEAIKVSLVR